MSDDKEVRRKKLEVMKQELQISKSQSVKMELELKVAQCEDDITRLREHQALHDQTISKAREEIQKLTGGANG